MAGNGEQEHPLKIYFVVWGLLFLLSAFSYAVDYYGVEPIGLKWFLLIALAVAKSGLILTYFMHLRWERASLVYSVALPPLLIFALTIFVMSEGTYVHTVRDIFFATHGH